VRERLLGDVSLKVLDRSRGPVLIAAQPRPLPASSAAAAGPAEARTASGEGESEAQGTER